MFVCLLLSSPAPHRAWHVLGGEEHPVTLSSYLDRQKEADLRRSNITRQHVNQSSASSKTGPPGDLANQPFINL